MDWKQAITKKIKTLPELVKTAETWRIRGERIVFTNGCFDLLHEGHLKVLFQAASEGDRLVVGINSDESVRQLKGAGRPVMAETERAMQLAAKAFVDAVVIFSEQTPQNLISRLQPDVLVKGGDYQLSEIVGAKEVQQHGGRVVVVPLAEGRSTTAIIQRIQAS